LVLSENLETDVLREEHLTCTEGDSWADRPRDFKECRCTGESTAQVRTGYFREIRKLREPESDEKELKGTKGAATSTKFEEEGKGRWRAEPKWGPKENLRPKFPFGR